MISFDHRLPPPLVEPKKLARITICPETDKNLAEMAVAIGKTQAQVIEGALQRASEAYVTTK